MRSQE